MTLKLGPWLCYAAFSLLLLLLYRKLCTLTETLVLLGMLICSPMLLMWISLKAWFGYAESLASSALILLAMYQLVFKPGSRDLYWSLALGLVSGLSLYILPFTFPVVLSAFVFLLWCRKQNRWRTVVLSGLLLVASAVPPYVLHDLTSDQKSASFMAEGRELGAPRGEDERPFVDRFLNECLPVVLGGRATWDDQRDLAVSASRGFYI